jgi:hypothetical protein
VAVYGNIQLTNTLFTVVNINENKKLRKYEMKGRGKRNTVVYLSIVSVLGCKSKWIRKWNLDLYNIKLMLGCVEHMLQQETSPSTQVLLPAYLSLCFNMKK